MARSTVLVYNPSLISADELPASIMDLADPKYAGMVSFSPTGADFQAIVAAVLDLEGEDATRAWLAGLKANGTTYDGNNVVLEAVNSGESAIGIEYHYYWYRDQAEAGENSDDSELYFFGNQDPGAFLSISGAGVLEERGPPGGGAAVRRLPDQRGGAAGARRQLRAGVPAQPGGQPAAPRSSRSASCSRRPWRSATSTATRSSS